MIRKILTASTAFLIVMSVLAQNPENQERMRVIKNDNSELIGVILKDDGKQIFIETESLGKLYINKRELKSIKKVSDVESKAIDSPGTYSSEHPFSTRHVFTTNAFPIKKGENYGMINLHGPEVHFALTDRFNVGVMTTWVASPLALALKYSFLTKNQRVHCSVGSLMLSSGFINGFRGFGNLSFGNVTFGDRNSNITLGMGYLYFRSGRRFIENGYSAYDNYEKWRGGNESSPFIGQIIPNDMLPMQKAYPLHGPILSLGGVYRVGAKATFIFDSMIGSLQGKREKVTTTPTGTWDSPMFYHEVSYTPYNATFVFIAPGMRFQTTDSFAWQFTIAQTSVVRSDRAKATSIPIPMVTLFKKF